MQKAALIALAAVACLAGKETSAQEGTCDMTKASPVLYDGNEELGLSYYDIKCGLDYVQATHKLGKRGTINGLNQPASYDITGIPANAVIEKAFAWSSYSGKHLAHNVTVTNPLNVTNSFPMVPIGHCKDKCWAYDSTKTYRADVTTIISGNGTYLLSGMPTNPPNPQKDTDGATLFIIFSDSTSNDMGHLLIKDGCKVQLGVPNTDSISGFVACDTASNAKAFTIIADLQLGNPTMVMNGDTIAVAWDWMNFIETPTQMNFQQTTSVFQALVTGDCYNVVSIGLHWFVPGCASALQVSTSMTPDSCGNCSATGTVNATGGYPPYSYQWDVAAGNQTTATATGLCAGTYNVTVTDTTNCPIFTEIVIIPGFVLSMSPTASSCGASCNGYVTVTPGGGTPPYTYLWDANANNQTTALATGLCPGVYYVSVTDNNNCTKVDSVIIGSGSFTINFASTPASCSSNCDGNATANPAGAVPPYSFQWDASANNQTTQTAGNLCPGTYFVTVTDDNGCTEVDSTIVGSPPPVTLTFNVINTGCVATIVGIPAGGNGPPYIYNWNVGGTTNTLIGVNSGTYILQAADAQGCMGQDTVTVVTNQITSTTATSTSSCENTSGTGTATASATGGNAPYSYTWNDPSGQTTATATGLAPGNYSVTITNANGCTGITSVTVGSDASPVVSATVIDESCLGLSDGAILLVVTGSGPFTYLWSNDATTDSISGLKKGLYYVTVTDTNNCATVDSFEVKALRQNCDELNVPTAFTPNSDGTNDRWNIRGLQEFPDIVIEVYNRWGSLVYQSEKGYPVTWDGFYLGSRLPSGVYYYILDFGNGEKQTGTVTLVY